MTVDRRRAVAVLLSLAASWLGLPAGAAPARRLDIQTTALATPVRDLSADRAEWRWRLTGTLIGPTPPTAVFATLGETRSVQLGEQIDGWVLSKVSPGEAILTGGNTTRRLTLDGFSPAEAAEAARQSAAAAAARNAKIQAALTMQERDIAASNDALLSATRQMQASGVAH